MGDTIPTVVYLTKDQIRAKDDSSEFDISVPEWGGSVRVRTPNFRDIGVIREDCTKSTVDPATGDVSMVFDQGKFQLLLIIFSCIAPNGTKLFNPDDKAWLEKDKNGGVVFRLANKIAKVSGIFDTETEVKKS